jgi:hypothetical protein
MLLIRSTPSDEHAEKEFIDPAIAVNLLRKQQPQCPELKGETAFHSNAVRDLPSYLFFAFLRRKQN